MAKEADTKEFKYQVADLAKKLDIEEASVRVSLRKHNVKKAGKQYGWNSKDEFDAVVTKLSTKGVGSEEKKPAKKSAPAKAKKAA